MQKNKSAYTLMELLLVIMLFGVFFLVGSRFLFRGQEKNVLYTETERLADQLKLAQQKSISAENGLSYGIMFNPGELKYILQPEGKEVKLMSQIRQLDVSQNQINFAKLSGKPDVSLEVEISTKGFKSEVLVNENGKIEFTKPEKK